MKRLILLSCFLFSLFISFGQSRQYIRADSVYIQSGNNGELILLNATRDSTGGLLINKGSGRTTFAKLRAINDSTLVIGNDTIIIRGKPGITTINNASGSGDSLWMGTYLKKLDHDATLTFSLNSNKILIGTDTLNPIYGLVPQARLKDSAAAISKRFNYIDVFLTAGQSNAQGEGDSALSPKVTPGTVYQWCSGSIFPGNDPIGIGYGVWVEAQSGSAWPAFGIEYNKLTGRKVCFVPSAVGATSQTAAAAGGNGHWDVSGTLVTTAMDRLDSALADLTAKGYTPVFRGVLWHQGEFDANAINSATITQATYITALQTMIGRFRTHYGKNMPFYIFRLGSHTSFPVAGYDAIRAGQQAVKESDSLTTIVYYNCADFNERGLMADPYHYTQAGYNEMGRFGAQQVASNVRNMWQPQEDDLYYLEGNVGIGTSRPINPFDVKGKVSIAPLSSIGHPGTSDFLAGDYTVSISNNSNNQFYADLRLSRSGTVDVSGPNLSFYRTGGTNPAVKAAIPANAWLGRFSYNAVAGDNTTVWPAADIVCLAEAVKSGFVAGSLRFATTDSTGDAKMRMKITNTGKVGIGYAFENPLAQLHVVGTGIFTDTLTATTMGNSDSSNRVASTAWVKRQGFGTGSGSATISDAVYGAGWDGNTTDGASKNALYDKINALEADSVKFYNADGRGTPLLMPVTSTEMYLRTPMVRVNGAVADTSQSTDSTAIFDITDTNFGNTNLNFTGNRSHNAKGFDLTIDSINNLSLFAEGTVSNKRTLSALTFNPTTTIGNAFELSYYKGKVGTGSASDSILHRIYVDASSNNMYFVTAFNQTGTKTHRLRTSKDDINIESDSSNTATSRITANPHYIQLNAMDSLLINGVQAAATADSALGLVYSHGNPSGNTRTYRVVKFPKPYKESSITSSATPSPTGDARENYLTITALAVNATIDAPSGTAAHNNWLTIEVKDDGTSRTLSWNAVYKAGDIPLPTATVAGKVAVHHFKYSTTISGSGWLYVGQTGNF